MNFIETTLDLNSKLDNHAHDEVRKLFVQLIFKIYKMNQKDITAQDAQGEFECLNYFIEKRFKYMPVGFVIRSFEYGLETEDKLCPRNYVKWLGVLNHQLEDSRKVNMEKHDKEVKYDEAKPGKSNPYGTAVKLRLCHKMLATNDPFTFEEVVESVKKGVDPYDACSLDHSMKIFDATTNLESEGKRISHRLKSWNFEHK